MSRRVSRPAALVLAFVLTFAAPSAFAAARRDRGMDPSFGTQIVRFFKHLTKKFFISSQDDIDMPSPPKP